MHCLYCHLRTSDKLQHICAHALLLDLANMVQKKKKLFGIRGETKIWREKKEFNKQLGLLVMSVCWGSKQFRLCGWTSKYHRSGKAQEASWLSAMMTVLEDTEKGSQKGLLVREFFIFSAILLNSKIILTQHSVLSAIIQPSVFRLTCFQCGE